MWCFGRVSTKIWFLGCFSSLTWNYLGVWWHVIFNIYTFFSPFVPIAYLDVFFLTQFCFDEYLSYILTCRQILTAIWKSKHWHFSISIYTAKFYFSLPKNVWKNKIFMTKTTLVLNHLTPVSITFLQLLSSLYDLSSSIQRHPLVF